MRKERYSLEWKNYVEDDKLCKRYGIVLKLIFDVLAEDVYAFN